jgi:hypothetical protein
VASASASVSLMLRLNSAHTGQDAVVFGGGGSTGYFSTAERYSPMCGGLVNANHQLPAMYRQLGAWLAAALPWWFAKG